MSEIEYLEYEYYDAQARWRTATGDAREGLRDQLIRLARRADREPGAGGATLADVMRTLAATIDEQLTEVHGVVRVPEEFQLTYQRIKHRWRTVDDSVRLHMLGQLSEMSHRRDLDRDFALRLTMLRGEIMAAGPTSP